MNTCPAAIQAVIVWGVLLMTAAARSDAAEGLVIAEHDRPHCVIVLPDHPADDESLAASELQTYVRKMTDVTLEIVSAQAAGAGPAIRIGMQLFPQADAIIRAKASDPASFCIRVSAEGVNIAGLSPEATLFGVYELLEQLGVRWYLPGDLGEVVPRTTAIVLPFASQVHAPSFEARHLQMSYRDMPWYRRQKFGGSYFSGRHGIPIKINDGEEHLLALVGGKRRKPQLCVSHPEVLNRAIASALAYFEKNPDATMIGMGPADGSKFCECDNCRALDSGQWDTHAAERSVTDRYIWFFNRVLDAVHERYPGKKLGFYCYHAYMLPPRRWKPNRSIVPAFAPITFCRIHSMNNPLCPSRAQYRQIIADWSKLVDQTYERGYFNNLACPDLPFSKVQCIREEIPLAHQAGIAGWRVESFPAWVPYATTFYVAGRLMWNVNTDVDAVLAEFYHTFFGPAADPMGQYLTLIDHSLRDTDCHSGGSYCLLQVFTPARRARALQLLDEAERLAGDDASVRQRVLLYRMSQQRLEAFLKMVHARNRFDFAGSKASLDTLTSLTDEMLSFRLYPNPPGFHPVTSDRQYRQEARALWQSSAKSYLQRFWSPCTEEGYERTVTRGRLVAGCPDEWFFRTDPDQVGENQQWYQASSVDGDWRTIKTLTATWSDQGLYHYKGVAWYHTTVEIPPQFAGQSVYLWFGGVDEQATVWVNEQCLGTTRAPEGGLPGVAGAFRPVEFDASQVVRCGEVNSVVVRVENMRLDELGTGGIVAPVMFWSPRRDTD